VMSLYVSVNLLALCVTCYRISSERREENSATRQLSSLEGIPSTEKGSQMYLSVQTVLSNENAGNRIMLSSYVLHTSPYTTRYILPDHVREGGRK